MKQVLLKLGIMGCVLTLCASALWACMGNGMDADSPQKANRAYMSSVNSIMEGLGENLDSFVDAVSRGDLVNMRTQADNAYRSLDELSRLEVPEELADVNQSYRDGADKLREALNAYIDLYTEASSGSLDQSTYSTRLASVQDLYDEGVNLMKAADEKAASK